MKLQVNEEVNTVIQDKAGRIIATCWRSPKKKKTIAKEFVRRWNAFEEGGIVEEIGKKCIVDTGQQKAPTKQDYKNACLSICRLVEAALAKI